MKHTLLYIILLLVPLTAAAQADRGMVRQGNRAFRAQRWAEAETAYRKALSANGANPQAAYNLGCALMMQQKDSLAVDTYTRAAQLEPNKTRRAHSWHNIGVIFQNHQQYQQAIDAYKQALRCNPSADDTRYNLALCQRLLKRQPPQNQPQRNKQQQPDKQQQQRDKQQQKQDKQRDKQQQQQPQQSQQRMSRDNVEQMLNAAQQQEQMTKRKLERNNRMPGRKKNEKNW